MELLGTPSRCSRSFGPSSAFAAPPAPPRLPRPRASWRPRLWRLSAAPAVVVVPHHRPRLSSRARPHHMPMFSSDDGAASEASVDARASAAPAAPRKVFDTPSEAESQAAISGQRRRRRAASQGRLARAKRAEAQDQRRSIRAIVFDYFLQGSMVSTRALSAVWQHPAHHDHRLPIRAAILIMERQSVRLLALLRTIREWQSSLQPVLFAESRMYDETPWRSRVGDMGEDGEMDVDDVAAKIMACTLQFVMVLRPSARAKQEADAACCSQEGCVVVPRPGAAGNVEVGSPGAPQQDVIIQGQLFTLLVPMADQEAHTVLTAIRQKMQLPATVAGAVASIFPRHAVLRCSDLHRSNLAAERQEDRAEGKRRPSALFRCAMHRSRTAEQRTLELDAATESFCFNLGRLWRANPGAMASFRKRVRKWVNDKLHIIPGPPPRACDGVAHGHTRCPLPALGSRAGADVQRGGASFLVGDVVDWRRPAA